MRSSHGELADEAGLADSGRAEQRHELRSAELLGLGERGPQLGDLTGASDEGRVEPAGGAGDARPELLQEKHVDLLLLSLQRDGRQLLGVDLAGDERPRGRAEEDPVARRGLLEPLRRPDRVARDREVVPGGEDLAGVDADPGGEAGPELRVEAETASRSSTAARTPRSASSSRTVGMPKTAQTASPMNFSIVPPWRSMIVLAPTK